MFSRVKGLQPKDLNLLKGVANPDTSSTLKYDEKISEISEIFFKKTWCFRKYERGNDEMVYYQIKA